MSQFFDPPLVAVLGFQEESTNLPRAQGNSVMDLVAGAFANEIFQIWSGARMAEYLIATDGRRHIWHSWLSSSNNLYGAHNPMSGELAYRRLTYTRGKDLIVEGYGRYPHGAIRALSLLGPTARPREVYQAMMKALLNGDRGAKFVRHCSSLSNELIRAVAALPSGMSRKSVLSLIGSARINYRDITFFTWAVDRLQALGRRESVSDIFNAHEPLKAVWEAILDLPFPNPPFAGKSPLVPVVSRGQLRSLATELDNCLSQNENAREAVLGVINMERYYYAWRGEQHALLEFRRLAPLGWYLKEARGRGNAALTDSTKESIFKAFSSSPKMCAAWEEDWCQAQLDDLVCRDE